MVLKHVVVTETQLPCHQEMQNTVKLELPLPINSICHHAPFYKESDMASSMHWRRIDLGRTKETGLNNYASQDDLSRKVTTAA